MEYRISDTDDSDGRSVCRAASYPSDYRLHRPFFRPHSFHVHALYELPLDGGSPRRLHRHDTDLVNDAWAPDGERGAYTAPETPLLIADGEEDTRVHPSQSLEMYRHLTVRKPDLPVRLVMYPGEGHGYTRATARYDFALRTMRWFDRYLKGNGPMPEGPLTEDAVAAPAGH